MDHHTIPDNARHGVAPHDAFPHVASRHRADARDAENRPHLRTPKRFFVVRGSQQSEHRLLDVGNRLIDNRIETNVNLFLFGQFGGLRNRTNVEADDDGVRGRRKHDIRLRNAARRTVDETQANFLTLQLGEGVPQRLNRAMNIALND